MPRLIIETWGVLDHETGLVWEAFLPTNPARETWDGARRQCLDSDTGGRGGWRLPSVHELKSLVVPGNPAGGPDLPAGHPFSNVKDVYWSAATDVDNPRVRGSWTSS